MGSSRGEQGGKDNPHPKLADGEEIFPRLHPQGIEISRPTCIHIFTKTEIFIGQKCKTKSQLDLPLILNIIN